MAQSLPVMQEGRGTVSSRTEVAGAADGSRVMLARQRDAGHAVVLVTHHLEELPPTNGRRVGFLQAPDGAQIDSNPFDVAALSGGSALVADAAANALLVADARGRVRPKAGKTGACTCNKTKTHTRSKVRTPIQTGTHH